MNTGKKEKLVKEEYTKKGGEEIKFHTIPHQHNYIVYI